MSRKKQKRKSNDNRELAVSDASNETGPSDQTAGLDEILRNRDEGDSKSTRMAVNAALRDFKAGKSLDPRILQLFKDFKLYQILVVVIIVIGFIMMLASMFLYSNGIIDEETQNNILIMANVVIITGMVIAFGRARPIKEDINAWYKVNAMALEDSNGKHGATEADIDKIFLSRARSKHVPPTPEYRKIRRVWMILVAVAAINTIIAVLMAQRSMDDVTIPVVMIICSFVLLLVAMLIERIKMKPQRDAYAKELDARLKQANKASRRKR